MKRVIFFAVIAVLTSCGSARHIADFNSGLMQYFPVSDGTVSWVKVFDMQDSVAVREWFVSSFDIRNDTGSRLIGETRPESLPYKNAGYNYMNIAILYREPCVVNFYVDFKEDRYRVVVSNIYWKSYNMTLDDLVLNGRNYNPNFTSNSNAQCLDDCLTYIFTPKISGAVNNGNW